MEYFRNQIKLALSSSNDPYRAEIVISNKGGPKLIDNGFMYTMHKKQTSNIRWRCVLRSSQCRGSLITSTDFKLPRVRMEHNHPPDYNAAELARTRYMALGRPPLLQEGHTIANDSYEQVALPTLNPRIKQEPPEELYQEMQLFNLPPTIVQQPRTYAQARRKSSRIMAPSSQGTSGGRTIRIATQSLVRQQLRNIAPAPLTQRPQQPKTLVLKTIPLKVKQVAPTTIKMAPRQTNNNAMPQPVLPQQSTEVCLRWNSYHSNMQNSFPSLLDTEQFVDVTLACEGRSLKCHKMILSSCSDYLAELLRENPCQHPIILMKDLKFWEVEALVKFMYKGEVNVAHDKLPQLLNAAEALQIKGLAGPSPSVQNEKPPRLVPHTKPLNTNTIAPSARVVSSAKEIASKATTPSTAPPSAPPLTTPQSSTPLKLTIQPILQKRPQKRQSSEPPQPRTFTKIRLQRPVTPTSPNLPVKLEPLDLPLSPTELFSHNRHHDEDDSTASNFDNLVMALHEDEDPGGDDHCSNDGDIHFSDLPGQSDDLNDNDDHMEFVPTDFLEQEQDIVEEADGEFSKSSNMDSEEEEDDEEEDEEDDDEVDDNEDEDDDPEDTSKRPSDDRQKINLNDRNNDKRMEKCTNQDKTL